MNLSYFKQRRQLPAQMPDTLWPHTDTDTDTEIPIPDWSLGRTLNGSSSVALIEAVGFLMFNVEVGVGCSHALWIATRAQLYRKTIHNYRAATYFEVNTFVAMAFGN